MLSIGCIQAQTCHTNRCPTGIATNNKWLESGVDPTLKSERFNNYMNTLAKEIIEITHASGYEHPCQFGMNDVDISMGDNNKTVALADNYGYLKSIVPYPGIKSLLECPHLGGRAPREEVTH
jgi:hypothetical protein